MKKIYFFMVMLLSCSINLNAQLVDNMEYCSSDGEIIDWSEWSMWGCNGQPACYIKCSSAQSHSGEWSGLVDGNQTITSYLDLGSKINGIWGLEFFMYVPSGKEAHFNLQGSIPTNNEDSVVGDFNFNKDLQSPGEGTITDTALGEISFEFPHDQWFKIIMNFDLSAGMSQPKWQLYINETEIISIDTPFSSESGVLANSLAAILFKSVSADNEYYIDNILFQDEFVAGFNGLFVDDMEYPNGIPETNCWWGLCWDEEPVNGPEIAGPGAGHNSDYSGLIPDDGITDIYLDLGEKIFGPWGLEFYMYVPSGKEGYWNILNYMEGSPIMGGFYFNKNLENPGIGVVEDTALGDVSFDFPHDQWFRIAMNYDLYLGTSAATWGMSINNVLVIPEETPFSNEAGTYLQSLGGINFFSISSDNEYYVDNFNYISDFLELAPIAGVNENNTFEFSMYPNPSENSFKITSEERINEVNIYSLQGSLIKNTSEIELIDISNLSTGIYFIEAISEQGKSVQKLIKN